MVTNNKYEKAVSFRCEKLLWLFTKTRNNKKKIIFRCMRRDMSHSNEQRFLQIFIIIKTYIIYDYAYKVILRGCCCLI